MKLNDSHHDALYAYTKALSVALGYRDELTQLHSERVQNLSATIGEKCGLDANELEALKVAASFHDIGKIGIPDHILLKPSSFNAYEWDKMKKHPEIGEKIIAAIEFDGAQQAAKVIRHHHERFDGSGYPDRLKRSQIPICSRIISIADNYDALVMIRSYHNARTHDEVIDILLSETGKKHDPELMQVFCEVIETGEFKALNS